MTAKVLVSACLVGLPVRYDGTAKSVSGQFFERWRAEGRLVTLCPEVAGGLSVPRPPAELRDGDGHDVLDGSATVETGKGIDVTAAFVAGAGAAVALARAEGIRVAVLKERSPSCGRDDVYDGTFSGTLVTGAGVTAAALERAGVRVFGESELDEADAALRALDDP